MTVAGIVTTEGGARAIAWANTARHRLGDGARIRDVGKLAIAPATGAVGVGAGLGAILDAARAAMLAVDAPERLCPRVTGAMRQAAHRAVARCEAALAGSFGRTTFAMAAHHRGRLLVHVFSGGSFFEPHQVTGWFAREVDGARAIDSAEPAGIVSVARRQLSVLRETMPEVGGGRLVIAELRPASVIAAAVFDLDTEDFSIGRPAAPECNGRAVLSVEAL